MRTELRFLLAVGLMIVVLVTTNLLFPPVPPEEPPVPDSLGMEVLPGPGSATDPAPGGEPETGELQGAQSSDVTGTEPQGGPAPAPAETVPVVEGPLFRWTFSSLGARMTSGQLSRFESFQRAGAVELLPEESPGALGFELMVDGERIDLSRAPFRVEPSPGLELIEGGPPQSLYFILDPAADRPGLEVVYTFNPDEYHFLVEGRVLGGDADAVFLNLGTGLAMNEARVQDEQRALAYVVNQAQEGIGVRPLQKVKDERIEEGPLHWAAFKSKYFVLGVLAGAAPENEEARLGGAVVTPVEGDYAARMSVSQVLTPDGRFVSRIYAGPQDYQLLRDQGRDFHNVNAYGWRLFRPVIRPFTGIIIAILSFLHYNLSLGYGWVLILFGIAMRVVLWPLNHKAMKAQLKNMAVQPLLQEVQTKYKNDPQKQQQELMKLYKEHGFNPLAGCLPMLLPWPVLIALFFVFQNTIELRGVPFLWIPDLSAPDPFYLLPVFLGLSMFLLQWISLRSMETPNPQMKTMMWIMPIFMLFIFANLASGLNLYYATANIATLPQQYLIAKERKQAQSTMKRAPKKTKK